MWIRPAILGAQPSGRAGCASATVGDMCLFIGGADRSPRAFAETIRVAPHAPRPHRVAPGVEAHLLANLEALGETHLPALHRAEFLAVPAVVMSRVRARGGVAGETVRAARARARAGREDGDAGGGRARALGRNRKTLCTATAS